MAVGAHRGQHALASGSPIGVGETPATAGDVASASAGAEMEFIPDKRFLVCVVDDDESVRESLPDLLGEFGYSARTFSSALEFLSSDVLDQTWCLLLDISMPGMSGIELQAELKRQGKRIPIIFITASSGEETRARVMGLGAAACLTKPFGDMVLLEALHSVMRPN